MCRCRYTQSTYCVKLMSHVRHGLKLHGPINHPMAGSLHSCLTCALSDAVRNLQRGNVPWIRQHDITSDASPSHPRSSPSGLLSCTNGYKYRPIHRHSRYVEVVRAVVLSADSHQFGGRWRRQWTSTSSPLSVGSAAMERRLCAAQQLNGMMHWTASKQVSK